MMSGAKFGLLLFYLSPLFPLVFIVSLWYWLEVQQHGTLFGLPVKQKPSLRDMYTTCLIATLNELVEIEGR